MEKKYTCSICGKEFEGHGNNAWPVNNGTCCDECNEKFVIPNRLQKQFDSMKQSAERAKRIIANEKEVTKQAKEFIQDFMKLKASIRVDMIDLVVDHDINSMDDEVVAEFADGLIKRLEDFVRHNMTDEVLQMVLFRFRDFIDDDDLEMLITMFEQVNHCKVDIVDMQA